MANQNTNPSGTPGGFNLAGFTPQQNLALLDLLVLAMYLDGNLAMVEETRVQDLLAAMGFATDYDRDRQFDESVTRIRQAQTPEASKAFTNKLAIQFTTPEQRKRVYDLLNELTALDGRVSSEESQFLSVLKEAFKL
jgi:hypothetical protein